MKTKTLLSLGLTIASLFVLILALCIQTPIPVSAAGSTIVTLGFDDGFVDAYNARAILSTHGMHATFYINSGSVGTSGYMTWTQISDLYMDGNEIGGHGLTHRSLKSLKGIPLRHEICDDRVALINQGFQPTSFAYPFGNYNTNVKQATEYCGYNSGRTVSGGPETIPPADAYALRVFPSVKSRTSLATLQGYITQVENAGGGWVILVLHHVCNNCDVYSISPANLTALLDWLQPRAATGTIVKTNTEVIGGSVNPPIPAQP